MIYEYPSASDPIRQGDIFIGLPRVEISLKKLAILSNEGTPEEATWSNILADGLAEGGSVAGVFALRSVSAIVLTQDCDALRAPDITLCEIGNIAEIDGSFKNANSPASWMKLIIQQSKMNLKWFYIPPDTRVGFDSKMAVNFHITIRIPREDLLEYRNLRKGRLGCEAEEHFRERLSEFFRRYPYDEWYPLDHDEFIEYKKKYPEANARSWQVEPTQAKDDTAPVQPIGQ
jgi:hypothetical protein